MIYEHRLLNDKSKWTVFFKKFFTTIKQLITKTTTSFAALFYAVYYTYDMASKVWIKSKIPPLFKLSALSLPYVKNKWSVRMIKVVHIPLFHQIYVCASLFFPQAQEQDIKYIKKTCSTWLFDMKEGKISGNYLYRHGYTALMPEQVIAEIQDIISLEAEKLFGIKYDNSFNVAGMYKLEAFVKYPTCPQMAVLESCIEKFHFSRRGKNLFFTIRDAYNIKPAKTIRKLFIDNPLVFPVYLTLYYWWGFRDINVMRLFLARTDLCVHLFSSPQSTSLYPDGIVDSVIFSHFLISDIAYWTREALKLFSERFVMQKLLINLTDHFRRFRRGTLLFANNGEFFPDSIFNSILHDDFTQKNYQKLEDTMYEWDERGKRRLKKEFHGFTYSEDERKLETEVDGYSFNLIENGKDLRNFADEMHNCVRSYGKQIINNNCNILRVKDKNGKAVACLEVREKKLVQAKGVCNASLDGLVKDAVKKWVVICGLEEGENLWAS